MSNVPAEPFYQPIGDLYLPDRVAHNVDILLRARTAVALFGGAAAGLVGLTGVPGLAVYIVGGALGDIVLQRVACCSAPEKFLPAPNRDFLTFGSLTTGILSFVLTWLIFYNVLFVF